MQKITIISVLILLFSTMIVKSQTTAIEAENTLWVNSFEKAKTIATKKKIAILLFFTGTDSCINCTKMRQNIIDTKEFIKYSRNRFVMFHVDCPKGKANKLSLVQVKQNKELVAKYNPKGVLPQIVVLDAKGGIKASANYLDVPVSEYLPQFKALLNMFQ